MRTLYIVLVVLAVPVFAFGMLVVVYMILEFWANRRSYWKRWRVLEEDQRAEGERRGDREDCEIEHGEAPKKRGQP